MNVKGFKDVTGAEFIAQVLHDKETAIEIKNPIMLMLTDQGLMPMPYLFSLSHEVNPTIRIQKSSLIAGPYQIREDIANEYKQKHGGIVEAPKGLVL